jgi:predicted double-glycine peptidase
MSLWIAIASVLATSLSAVAATPELPANHLPVPLIRQATDYSCGPASLLGVILYWQAGDMGESALYKLANTTETDGTTYLNLGNAASQYGKANGLDVETRDHLTLNDLRLYLTKGTTVILNIQAWRSPKNEQIPWSLNWEDGHFVVLVAMDADFVYFMDPSASAAYGYMPLLELEDRWHDYDMVNGQKVVSDHVGIAIRGTNPMPTLLGPLIRIN